MANFITKLFSSGASELVKDVGGVLDELITSTDEKLAAELKIKELIGEYKVCKETFLLDRRSDFSIPSCGSHILPESRKFWF